MTKEDAQREGGYHGYLGQIWQVKHTQGWC